MNDEQLNKLAERCARAIEERLGWKNFLGNVEKNLKEFLPIILEEICKDCPKKLLEQREVTNGAR